MKKLSLLFVIAIIFASCDKREVELRVDPYIASDNGIVAVIYDGNTSCDELEGSYVASTGKIDFVNGSFVFEQGSDWPFDLEVTISEDGRYVSFALPATSQYCVGAVIAKGGNASNVFKYNPGVKSDKELSAPINSSGNPAQLSNLTFCFVECPTETPYYISFKSYFTPGSSYVHSGTGVAFMVADFNFLAANFVNTDCWWAPYMGTTEYLSGQSVFSLKRLPTNEIVGTLTVSKDVNNLTVVVDLKGDPNIPGDEGLLTNTYLYVGLNELNYTSCPDYISWTSNLTVANKKTFIIPLN